MRGQRGHDRVLQRDFDQHPFARAVAAAQRGENRGGEMDAAEHVDHRRPGLHRRPVGLAGGAQHAAHRLHHGVESGEVAIRSAEPVALAGRIDEPRVDRAQHLVTEAETFHRAVGEVLGHDVGARDHPLENVASLVALEVERYRALVDVEDREPDADFAPRRAI